MAQLPVLYCLTEFSKLCEIFIFSTHYLLLYLNHPPAPAAGRPVPPGSEVEKKKMNRSLSSVLTLMASLSSPNIVVDQFLMGGIQHLPFFIFGIQSHLLPQVDLDVLLYERVVLDLIDTLFSIHFSLPNVLKTKPECPILFSNRLVFQGFVVEKIEIEWKFPFQGIGRVKDSVIFHLCLGFPNGKD